jgi:activating signal cointegrator complex subunit 1
MMKKNTSQALQAGATALTEDVVSTVNRILGSIADVAATDARDQALRALVNNAIDLSRLLAVQKAVFEVAMPRILPHQKTMFDANEMEDIGGEDEESLVARDICCVTFPSIIKSGDEHGNHSQFRNVIAKARVLCSPE